jgi:hypothetical protein
MPEDLHNCVPVAGRACVLWAGKVYLPCSRSCALSFAQCLAQQWVCCNLNSYVSDWTLPSYVGFDTFFVEKL